MMSVLAAIALKSLVIAAATLGLLALMKRRSASERSWVAHIGLLALVTLAFAPLVLPSWQVEAPALMGHAQSATPMPQLPPAPSTATADPLRAVTAPAAPVAEESTLSSAAAATVLYAIPAAILLFVTLLALLRLVALRARADVLVDGHWLSALARAQRRMGFKHGTALLTSDELASPISWGLMRPVILLNTRAVEAAGEAEAIIAHELAHVARLDWAKLLLARVATALFWFNPLVWMLAGEAHQLREETADDAVLGANIADTDYAQLLVGVARHECPGLLLGAHGVAPSKSSLARRVARVLDAGSARTPAARPFAYGVLAGAALVAAPLAALTLTPGGAPAKSENGKVAAKAASKDATAAELPPSDLAHIIADGVTTAVAAVAPAPTPVPLSAREIALAEAEHGRAVAAQARMTAQQAREAARQARLAAAHGRDDGIDAAVELKALGVTPEYVAALRAAAPQLANVPYDDFAGLKAVGVTPEYVRSIASAGLRNIDPDDLTGARAVGVTGDYIARLRALGIRGDIDDYVQLRATGVTPEFVQKLRRSGYTTTDPDKIVEMQALGIDFTRYRAPPAPPRPPKVPPPGWNPLTDPDWDSGGG